MSIADVIYAHSLRLPEPAAREVLAYIEGLEHRYGVPATAVPDLHDTEDFLAMVCGGLSDDFPDDITDADLGHDAPRQALDRGSSIAGSSAASTTGAPPRGGPLAHKGQQQA